MFGCPNTFPISRMLARPRTPGNRSDGRNQETPEPSDPWDICRRRASPLKKSKTRGSYLHKFAPVRFFLADETAIPGVLPDGKSGARRTPNIDHFLVGSLTARQPIEEICDQRVNGCFRHGFPKIYFNPATARSHPDLNWDAVSREAGK